MHRPGWAITIFAFVASLLVVTATPAAAATAVASIHNTDTDFNNGTLTNVNVQGTGLSATVNLSTVTVVDGFEDNDATDTAAGDWNDWSGDTGSFSADGTTVIRGTYSGKLTAGSGNSVAVRTSRSTSITTNATVFVRIGSQTNNADDSVSLFFESTGGFNILQIAFEQDGDIVVGGTDTGTDWSASTNYQVKVDWDFSSNSATIFLDGNSLGSYSFGSASSWGGFELSNDNMDGASSVDVWVDDLAEIPYRNGTYVSQNHTASQVEDAFTNFEQLNITADVTWEYWDGNNWQTADTSTYTSAGNKSVDVSGNPDADKWRVTVDYSRNNDTLRYDAGLTDEGVQFNATAPTFDNSTATPSGGTNLNDKDVTLSIQVNDSDFAAAQGDNVTVSFWHKGPDDTSFSKLGENSTQSNDTVSFDASFTEGGDHEWFADATDSYGEDAINSSTFSFTIPSTLDIRNETPEHRKINNANVELIFYEGKDDDPTIVNRSVSNGEVDLSGLPVGTEFIVHLETPNHHTRTVLLESIFDQDTVYLLRTDKTTDEIIFALEDSTGDFPADSSEIVIQRAINDTLYDPSGGDGYNWTNVAGDDVASDGTFTADLQRDTRYRIIVQNDDGDKRVLGSYTPSGDATTTVRIGSVEAVPEDPGTQYRYNASYTNNSAGTSNTVSFEYNDTVDRTDTVYVEIHEYRNESNVLFSNTTFSGPLGTLAVTETVPSDEEDTTWVVKAVIERDGESRVLETIVGPTETVLPAMEEWLVVLISLGSIWIVAGLFSKLNADYGALAVAGLGGLFWYVDFLPAGTGTGVVVLALILAGIIFVNGRRGQGAAP